MAGYDRPGARRIPSGPFSRLLPATIDPLDSVGLPSKGDTRLNDFKAQEAYYGKIVDRYVKFCADSGNSQELARRFASMSMNNSASLNAVDRDSGPNTAQQKEKVNHSGKLQKHPQSKPESSRNVSSSSSEPSSSIPNIAPATSAESYHQSSSELTTILHAMRKLRESIVSISRRDVFAQRAYIFIIRSAILVRHLESYHPALLYLLSTIHPQTPLSAPELHEFVGYHILDLACRQGDLQAAHAARLRYAYKDRRVGRVLKALVHDDWVSFWRIQRGVDGHQREIMEWAVEGMRMHALKCLGRSYFSAEKDFVEKSASMEWEELVRTCKVGWELEGDKVTIRRPKAK